MIYLNDLKSKGVWKIRVDLADAFPKGFTERDVYDGLWVELREPSGDESFALTGDGSRQALDLAIGCIIDHNIEQAENKKASTKDVADLIRSSSTLSAHVVRRLITESPLAKGSAATSET